MYQHRDHQQQPIDLPSGKVVCVGRNYADHINELNNATPEQPILFIKPSTALCDVNQPLTIPTVLGECHNELELALLIQQPMSAVPASSAFEGVWGLGLALDLTLREVQQDLKQKGLPWERAKAFDRSCPVSGFVPMAQLANPEQLTFSLQVNKTIRQQGDSRKMLWPMTELLAEISKHFTLLPGDLVLTGTPKGVGPLVANDDLRLQMPPFLDITTRVAS